LPHPQVSGRAALADAADLIARFGDHAALEAASRAARSRRIGNVVTFCHWRQTERAVALLNARDVTDTVH
jgi:hypothetical protein